MLALGPGDVISASYGPGNSNLNNVEPIWLLIRMASDLGITCCVAAGNDCRNLDELEDLGDSGGITVGACSPGAPWYRLAFSNFTTEPSSGASNTVHVRAWGAAVTAAGTGDLFYPTGPHPERRAYTTSFGGTSAATPQIAGLVACLQGFAKQFYGIPLHPSQIRGAMAPPEAGPPLNPPRLFGSFAAEDGCCLDLDTSAPPNWAGFYPVTAGDFGSTVSRILNQYPLGHDQSPTIESFVVARGEHLFGNIFSLSGVSNAFVNPMVIQTEHTLSGNHPSVLIAPSNPIGQGVIGAITYIATGQMADLVVSARVANPSANLLDVRFVLEESGSGSLAFIEAWDWQAGRWIYQRYAPVAALPFHPNGYRVMGAQLARARRFIHQENKRVLVRLWVFGFATHDLGIGVSGGGAPDEAAFTVFVDHASVEMGQQFGEVFPP